MHKIEYYNNGNSKSISVNDIDNSIKADSGVLWVDITNPDDADIKLLTDQFHLHSLTIEDIQTGNQRPKVDDYNDYLFIVMHEWHPSQSNIDAFDQPCVEKTADIYVYISNRYVITINNGNSLVCKTLRDRWNSSRELQGYGAYALLYVLLDTLVDDYFPSIDVYGDRIDSIEFQILQPISEENVKSSELLTKSSKHILSGLLLLRRSLMEMRRSIAPLRDSVNILLRHMEKGQNRDIAAYYQDAYDHTIRILDTIDTYRDLLAGTLDAYLAVGSNRLNEIVKILTSVSIILMSIAAISGIYGMNFSFMPELHHRYGYPAALFAMALISVIEWLYFRKRNWI